MKKALLLFLLCQLSLVAFGQTQKLPVQGKLFEDNQPVNTTRDFRFSIPDLGWEQSFAKVPINEGLYAVELDVPDSLFFSVRSRDLQIEVDGTLLSLVRIHAPIESDPSVPNFLKDGLSWEEISGKPVILDQDTTNELQTLILEGNVLSLSKGNSVTLNISGSGAGGDTLTVGSVQQKTVAAAKSNTAGAATSKGASVVRQSFLAEQSGQLVAISVEFANTDGLGAEIRLYEGDVNTQALMLNNFPASAFTPTTAFQDFTPPNNTVYIKKNTNYVFEIAVVGGDYIFKTKENGYPFGNSDLPGDNLDLNFEIKVVTSTGPSFKVDEQGRVGIGTNTPTSTLTVNGRIEDETGFVMPVGTILAWAGQPENVPKGWLICDGSEVNRGIYADLFEVLGEAWGNGDGSTTFKLPVGSGRFLRGWSGTSTNDPDKDSRWNTYGGNTGNKVGSYQQDAFQGHKHFSDAQLVKTGTRDLPNSPDQRPNQQQSMNSAGIYNAGYGTPRISSETRPKNLAVLFIIKY